MGDDRERYIGMSVADSSPDGQNQKTKLTPQSEDIIPPAKSLSPPNCQPPHGPRLPHRIEPSGNLDRDQCSKREFEFQKGCFLPLVLSLLRSKAQPNAPFPFPFSVPYVKTPPIPQPSIVGDVCTICRSARIHLRDGARALSLVFVCGIFQ